MMLIQHPFFILLIVFNPVMNDPQVVQRFKYHSIENTAEVYTKDITNENLGINIFQILSSTSVVVFELVKENGFCRVYMWFGLESELYPKIEAVTFASKIIADMSITPYCTNYRVIREIPSNETDDFCEVFNLTLRDPPRRLYMVKGEHNVVIKQVPPYITRYNLNDVFVLHSEKGIHTFIGSGANENEKEAALKLVEHIKKYDMTDYSSATGEEIIDWKKICKEGPPRKNKKWLTFISMFHNGKKYFFKKGIPKYHENTDSEFENLRYSKVEKRIISNTDGRYSDIENLSVSTFLEEKDEHTYIVSDGLSLRNAQVYIGKKSTAIAIEKALRKAEILHHKDFYQIKLIEGPSFDAEFIINFTDYQIYLGKTY